MGGSFEPRCIHFAGSMKCRQGLDVNAFRDDEGRLPCMQVRGVHGTIECDERTPPKHMEPAAGPLQRALAALTAGDCPTCGQAIQQTTDVGRFRVALPCGHRLGRAP